MANRLAHFVDRHDAGRKLAVALERFRADQPVVIALPRGGVPVAYEVARELGAPLDIVVVRKIGAPMQPEYGIGAIGEGGVRFLREGELETVGIRDEELEAIVARESAELERRTRLYRGDRDPIPVAGKTVIMVDDGVATGGTAIVAGKVLRAQGAERVVLAVPVGPPGTAARLADDFDEIVCLEQPEGFFGIGTFYADFGQTSDEEVTALLAAGRDPVADPADRQVAESTVEIEPASGIRLTGDLRAPGGATGLVIFAHGSGSGRLSPRNRQVAELLNDAGLATLLFDLLAEDEAADRGKVFDIALLSERLRGATAWAQAEPGLAELPLGFFGASTGAAAALSAAADLGEVIGAVVSRGGRPDLARERLSDVVSPTLLIVGGSDSQVLELNEEAAKLLGCEYEVIVVPGATHLFEEPGALERVSALAADWFTRHLRRQ